MKTGMTVVVGLGNPGPAYRSTRHNVGFMTLDELAEELGVAFFQEKYGGLVAKGRHEGRRLLLFKPLTFVNRSGESVRRALRYTAARVSDVLVVLDDVHLSLGRLRLRLQGSAGGHKGLQSIIDCLGTEEFARLRIGIGNNSREGQLADYVLDPFAPEELETIRQSVRQAAEIVLIFAEAGAERAMNACNAPTARLRRAQQELR